MWVLCLGLGLHLRVSKPFRWVFLNVAIAFKVNSSFKLAIPELILTSTIFWGFIAIPTIVLTFTNWNFGASLQYLHPHLPLPSGILGLHYNT